METAALFWSGGKDAAYACFLAKKSYHIKYLITTFSRSTGRVTMHGLDQSLLERQAQATGITLKIMWTEGATNEAYEQALSGILNQLKEEGITTIIFGDIFLEDLREYRDALLEKHGLKSFYPLWKKDTSHLLDEMTAAGFDAIVCCADGEYFSEDVLGSSIRSLPEGDYDLCGENGEYHTFCFSGPLFKQEIAYQTGKIIVQHFTIGNSTKTFRYLEIC